MYLICVICRPHLAFLSQTFSAMLVKQLYGLLRGLGDFSVRTEELGNIVVRKCEDSGGEEGVSGDVLTLKDQNILTIIKAQ